MSTNQASEGDHDSQTTEANSKNDSQVLANNGAEPTSQLGARRLLEELPKEKFSGQDIEYGSGADDEEDDEKSENDDFEYDSDYDSDNDGRYIAPKKTLSQLAQEAVIKILTKAIDGDQATARYCCGGSIPAIVPEPKKPEVNVEETAKAVGEKTKDEKKDEKEDVIIEESPKDSTEPKGGVASTIGATPKVQVAPPVTIRWDCTTNTAVTRRLTIAADVPFRFDKRSPLSYLIKACGRKGLDQSEFTIDFHPQNHGIIDALSQILLPGWKGNFLSNLPEHRGVRVGNCRLHVSTTTAESKICVKSKPGLLGHLTVCLPTSYKGGDLTVSDDGHSSVFDWSDSAVHSIRWLALMSKCTIEFSPVTEGTQILLVYDLIVTKRIGDGVASGNIIDPKLSPLYRGVRDTLLQPGFMKTGGTLGYYCRYSYSHTSSKSGKRLPFALQGVDMVFYSVFKSLGLEVQVRPIIDPSDIDQALKNRFEREFSDDYDEFDDDDEYEEWMAMRSRCQGAKIGDAFHDFSIGYYESIYSDRQSKSFDQGLAHTWPMKERHGITFLNEPYSGGRNPRELAVVMMEDEAFEDDMIYDYSGKRAERLHSLVGMLVHVPKLADRNQDI